MPEIKHKPVTSKAQAKYLFAAKQRGEMPMSKTHIREKVRKAKWEDLPEHAANANTAFAHGFIDGLALQKTKNETA